MSPSTLDLVDYVWTIKVLSKKEEKFRISGLYADSKSDRNGLKGAKFDLRIDPENAKMPMALFVRGKGGEVIDVRHVSLYNFLEHTINHQTAEDLKVVIDEFINTH